MTRPSSAGRWPGYPPASGPCSGAIRTAGFTITRNANGSATLTINPRVLFDPDTLQGDLAQYGIPAKVTAASFCSSDPAPSGFSQVVTFSPACTSTAPTSPPASGALLHWSGSAGS
jgi:hypothetical protein